MNRAFTSKSSTERLKLHPLASGDLDFVLELLNSEGWLKYIGDRKVRTKEQAEKYILDVLNDQNVNYWVARLTENDTSVGVVTLIKKDYLSNHDIGFAFLPAYAGKGYAFEVTQEILQ